MYKAWNQWFIETSDNLDALKKTADEIYRHRVANYLWVLKKRAENVQKDIELAEWLLKEDAVTE